MRTTKFWEWAFHTDLSRTPSLVLHMFGVNVAMDDRPAKMCHYCIENESEVHIHMHKGNKKKTAEKSIFCIEFFSVFIEDHRKRCDRIAKCQRPYAFSLFLSFSHFLIASKWTSHIHKSYMFLMWILNTHRYIQYTEYTFVLISEDMISSAASFCVRFPKKKETIFRLLMLLLLSVMLCVWSPYLYDTMRYYMSLVTFLLLMVVNERTHT